MRWNNLTVEDDAGTRLPGYRDPAVVRRFDAPDALDVRFYEVRAKSVLNKVPQASRMPFRWTINPYRGCSHACLYCLEGETPILMVNGYHKPVARLRVGDEIYGTERRGYHRRYVRTRVLAHWASVRQAYRVVLEDGTELVSSGDHLFLTEDGWEHVTGAHHGRDRRPHLAIGKRLLGTGGFAAASQQSDDYQRGYLCGIIRGADALRSYPYDRRGQTSPWIHHDFRLALADSEALERAERYLIAQGVSTTPFSFHTGSDLTRPIGAIRTQVRSRCERIRELIRWPLSPNDAWRKGFLAGSFDAEGSGGSAIRLGSKDDTILRWITSCMGAFGFRTVLEGPNERGVEVVRLRGGLRERVRFFHLVDPAIRRRLEIDGMAVTSDARTAIASIEPLGLTVRLYDITTGTGDFIADGVVSHNCFARPTHAYLDFDAGRDFEREIVTEVRDLLVVRDLLAGVAVVAAWRSQ